MPADTSSRTQFAAIFIISVAVLAYQVLLTRLFSVMLYYHFAYAGISLVMLGLTIGAVHVYVHPDRFTTARLGQEWAQAALLFSLTGVLAVMWFIYSPGSLPPIVAVPLVDVSMLVFVVPFVFSGICVTLILTRSAFSIGRLYAADLAGAAAGCIGIVALLFVLDPISIFFAIAAFVGVAAMLMAPPGTRLLREARILTALFAAATLLQGGLYLTDHDHLRLIWAKAKPQDHLLFERWNALARVRVVPYSAMYVLNHDHPFGWGFGHDRSQTIDQYALDIDADAATVMTRFDGHDLSPFAFLGNDVINMGYHIRPVDRVAIIGVGGGRDVMSALYFGAKHITGIEINPAIFEALTERFADFTGHLDRRPDVCLVRAEARSWINHSAGNFDLIQVSLIDTWAATAAGGLTMSENKLYTVDAWREFLARLAPGGELVVSRWFDPVSHRAEFYRLLSLAAEALRARGVPDLAIRGHILAFNANQIVTVAVSPTVFPAAEVAAARAAATQEGFRVLIDPATAWDSVSATIASGQATPAFYDRLALDLTAPTDNRPFFFYTWKPFSGTVPVDSGQDVNAASLVMCLLLAGTLLGTVFFVFWPLARHARGVSLRAMAPYLGYFGAIGVAFMLIEISQMQRLMVFLGHPIYGLTVVLFTLLLAGGAGSFTVGPGAGSWRRPALLCGVLCATGLLTPLVTQVLAPAGLVVRVVASVALLAPAGFFMGMMFPTGMLLSTRYRAQQAWFWGINGATSVFASVLGMAMSIEVGIAQTYWAGVVCYAACFGLALGLGVASADTR